MMDKLSREDVRGLLKHISGRMDASEETFLFVHKSGVCTMNVYDSADAEVLTALAVGAITSVGLSGGNPLSEVMNAVTRGTEQGFAVARVAPISEGNEHRAWPVVVEESDSGGGEGGA